MVIKNCLFFRLPGWSLKTVYFLWTGDMEVLKTMQHNDLALHIMAIVVSDFEHVTENEKDTGGLPLC